MVSLDSRGVSSNGTNGVESFQVCQNNLINFFQIVGRLGIHLNYTPVVRKLVQTPQLRIKKTEFGQLTGEFNHC